MVGVMPSVSLAYIIPKNKTSGLIYVRCPAQQCKGKNRDFGKYAAYPKPIINIIQSLASENICIL